MDPNALAIEFICPICHVLPVDPVLAEDGFIYDRECIEDFIASRRDESKEIISPMTGKQMGDDFIYSEIVEETIRQLIASAELKKDLGSARDNKKHGRPPTEDIILDTEDRANNGDVESMLTLAKWYLFGQQDGVELDANKGYYWSANAASNDDFEGKAYQGFCLIRGLGVQQDWEDGYEHLVESASQEENGIGRDFAAYALGSCYRLAKYGFKQNMKKADKWFGKVKSPPIWLVNEFGEYSRHDQAQPEKCGADRELLDGLAKGNGQKADGSSALFPEGLMASSVSLGYNNSSFGFDSNESVNVDELDDLGLPSLRSRTTGSTSKMVSGEKLNLGSGPSLEKEVLERETFEDDLSSVPSICTATTASTSKWSSSTSQSIQSQESHMRKKAVDGPTFATSQRRCERCLAELPNASDFNHFAVKLCASCKVIGG